MLLHKNLPMKNVLCFLVLIYCITSTNAQDELVKDENVPEAEFHVAINPLDQNNIIIATIHGFGNPDANNLRIHYTYDFGASWATSEYTGEPEGYRGAGDPVVAFDTDGNALLVNLSQNISNNNVNTVLSKSADGGATWSLTNEVAIGNTDKPWLAIDTYNESPGNGNIYIPVIENNNVLYTLSSDLQNKSTATIPIGDALPSVAIRSDGEVFTSILTRSNPSRVHVQQFTDEGSTLVHNTEIVNFPDYTFDAPWISARYQPTQYLAIDNSGGTHDGRIYLSYTASESGDPDYFDVLLTYSDDDGHTWSTPNIVHGDNQNDVQQFYSSIYVNNQGVVIMDWYDRRNHSDASKLTDFYLGVSYDGGDTFVETQLNSVATDFDNAIPSSNLFGIGEYHQVVATNDTIVSFWSDGRTNDGDLNIYMAKAVIDGTMVSLIEVGTISDVIKIDRLYPNPINDVTKLNFELKESMNLKTEIISLSGSILWTHKLTSFNAGKHSLIISGETLVPGRYFVRLSSDTGYYQCIKMIKQ